MPAILDNKSKIYLQLGVGLRHCLEVHHIGDSHSTEYGKSVHKILVIAEKRKMHLKNYILLL